MVHRRELEGRELVLGNQGALWGNAMTWWDHDTGSVWSQPLGEAIAGPRAGATLELLPSTLTTWDAWVAAHPSTEALDAPGSPSSFSLETMVVVVDFTTEVAAYPIPAVRQAGVVNDVVAGVPVAVVVDPTNPERWAVFSRVLDDRVVDLVADDTGLIDPATNSLFDPFLGIGRSGELEGEILDKLPAFTSFPRDFRTFWPGGRIWEG